MQLQGSGLNFKTTTFKNTLKKGIYKMILDEILTVEETANILRISISELRKLMTLRQITYFEIGEDNSKKKNKRFRRIDIENYINSHLIKDMATYIDDKEDYYG